MVEATGGMVRVSVNGTTLMALEAESIGPDVFACIRAEDVLLEQGGASGSSARNHLTGTVQSVTMLGASARVTLDCGFPLVAMVTRSTVEEFKLATGLVITAAIKAGAVHLVSRQGD